MNIKAIPLKNFLKQTDSLYKNIIIASTRARQIINDRYQEFAIEEDIEDSDQLTELLDDIDYLKVFLDKVICVYHKTSFQSSPICSIFLLILD